MTPGIKSLKPLHQYHQRVLNLFVSGCCTGKTARHHHYPNHNTAISLQHSEVQTMQRINCQMSRRVQAARSSKDWVSVPGRCLIPRIPENNRERKVAHNRKIEDIPTSGKQGEGSKRDPAKMPASGNARTAKPREPSFFYPKRAEATTWYGNIC